MANVTPIRLKLTPPTVPGLSRWTWAELEADLTELAQTEASRLMVTHLVEATRLQAPFLPPPAVAREIGAILLAVTDPGFPSPEGRTMT